MLIDAFKFKEWADIRTILAVERIDAAIHSNSYAFALQQLNHIVIVEELFRSRLESKVAPHNSTNTYTVPSLLELKSRLVVSLEWYLKFVSNLEAEEKNSRIPFVFADGKKGEMTVDEILFHVLSHGSYHRGQLLGRLIYQMWNILLMGLGYIYMNPNLREEIKFNKRPILSAANCAALRDAHWALGLLRLWQ